MLIAATIIFSLGVLLGLYLLSYILQSKNTPKGVAFIHGSLGAVGIIILIIALCYLPIKPIAALIVFILAAMGGFVLMFRDITGRSLPWWLALGHGLIGLSGLVLLIIFMFQH